ncbi:hypothetical protein B0H34DRAFT_702391 [Crassisporium funariophilum]|nr:hypothetical protein B0H34DRAFT_702391 [Crassisporium funariophilum]
MSSTRLAPVIITTIKVNGSPPIITTSNTREGLFTRGQKVLSIDTGTENQLPDSPGTINVIPAASLPAGKSRAAFLKSIRDVVADDMKLPSSARIDCLTIGPTTQKDPDLETSLALDGLSPTHLQVVAGYIEECNLRHINKLQHQWNELQSVTLVNVCTDITGPEDVPRVFSQIESLSLIYCCGLQIVPPGGFKKLKTLIITQNNALDMFNFAFDLNPHFAHGLEELEIQSTNGCDLQYDFYVGDFHNRLKQCKNICQLRLALNHDIDVGLAPYIPSSVEHLVFHSSSSQARITDLNDWIQQAQVVTWLPKLKSIRLEFNATRRMSDNWTTSRIDDRQAGDANGGGVSSDSIDLDMENNAAELEAERQVLYDCLKSRIPPVEILI